ncbi:hypothetical protein KM043_007416 [Ampulex compressa]|nr:hypothetical protein KM043_007416 [Ampulex compressa]
MILPREDDVGPRECGNTFGVAEESRGLRPREEIYVDEAAGRYRLGRFLFRDPSSETETPGARFLTRALLEDTKPFHVAKGEGRARGERRTSRARPRGLIGCGLIPVCISLFS